MAGGEQRSYSSDGAAAELLRLRLRSRAEGGGREARATEQMEWPGGSGRRPDQVKPVGRGAPIAGVRPPRGRRWLGRGGRPRAGERGGGGRPGRYPGLSLII